jgi:predicted nucleic acid-binding protein
VVTEIELYSFHNEDPDTLAVFDDFINSVYVIDIDQEVKRNTIAIRKNHKLKLHDSLIAASAIKSNAPLITADKAFKKVALLDLIIYELN